MQSYLVHRRQSNYLNQCVFECVCMYVCVIIIALLFTAVNTGCTG